MTDSVLLRTREVCQVLGLSTRTVYRMMEKGELPRMHLGGSVRVHRDDLNDYIERKRQEAKETS